MVEVHPLALASLITDSLADPSLSLGSPVTRAFPHWSQIKVYSMVFMGLAWGSRCGWDFNRRNFVKIGFNAAFAVADQNPYSERPVLYRVVTGE